ncbi:MFS transporter [Crenobacter cavernae]|uniref:MFS transporter n=1 Tax=Crenobacter cavernae TaxID=2290923 RepID=A0ABY0FDJ1_9NEIS|nr:MFS transporter [Crenobacter cavernae]RXZ44245.1 MFS transporter [Crenobacter cavernae]
MPSAPSAQTCAYPALSPAPLQRPPQHAPAARHVAGSVAYRRTSAAMFVGGFTTFAMLYGLQPLMPVFSAEFGASPAAASGVVSAATGTMAAMLIPASLLADRYGRKPLMNASLFAGAILMLAAAFAHDFSQLVGLRALMGVALAGLPAVAMAYLSEEIDPKSLGRSMGLYIAGNALGGMSGRLVASLLADWLSWRWAVGALGGFGLVAALLFWHSLPASQHFRARRVRLSTLSSGVKTHFADAGLPWLFLIGFVLMGCMVSLYNYLGYRLGSAPFSLSHSALGAVFGLYVVGMAASAWAGRLADRYGRRHVLWWMVAAMASGLALTVAPTLWVVVPGIALFTFGFFGAHSVASSWVGRRVTEHRALATALYLTAYYLGSSGLGTVSGLMWDAGGWSGVAALLGAGLAVCLAAALKLRTLEPLPQR